MTDDVAAEIKALRRVFNCDVLLCLWHVRRAWLKHVRSKASKETNHDMFKDLGNIMHACKDDHDVRQAIDKICKYHIIIEYIVYIIITYIIFIMLWVYFVDMWAKAYRTTRHANQETNNAIESYHGYIKHTYLCHQKNMSNRWLDWLLWMLLTKIEDHY
eukprot:Gb_14367 [translate_table: standard]